MEFKPTLFADAWVVKPNVFADERGFFLESYSAAAFAQIGLDKTVFVQDNHSLSRTKGVLRGLHFQRPPFSQTKILRVTRGAIYDVIVDLRPSSPTYRKWQGFELSTDNFLMLVVPQGFAHGFCTLVADTEVLYKVDCVYTPSHDGGVRWDDPTLCVDWPVKDPTLSSKDQQLPLLADMNSPF